MAKSISKYQESVLKTLSGKIDDFYLGGGTALSQFYFHHRESVDLDFFTKNFLKSRIVQAVNELKNNLGINIKLVGEQIKPNMVKMAVYNIDFTKNVSLKIDFIEDWLDLIRPSKVINKISILSLEDIYLRKIYAITGTIESIDIIGRKKLLGGRQNAKDFYDIYCLSHIFMNLSTFALKYCDATKQEALITWFRTYDRMETKTGLLDLMTKNRVDYNVIEKHFKKEIDKLLEKKIGLI